MDGKIVRRDPQRVAGLALGEGVEQGLANIDVERISELVFLGFLQAVALRPAQSGCVAAPATLVEHLKDLAQRFIADLPYSFGCESGAVAGPHDVTFFLQHLLDTFQIFEVLVGLLSQQVADLFEVEFGGIAHTALAPAEKTLQTAQLTDELARLARAHALRSLHPALVPEPLQL